jgi:hypothetical protein
MPGGASKKLPRGSSDAGLSLPAGLLERLRSEIPFCTTSLAARQVAKDGTTKLLLRLAELIMPKQCHAFVYLGF